MLKFYKLVFIISMISGTLITISSYSWMSMWMGLEINLLSIIPLLSSDKNSYSNESTLKYFITQTLASSILMFSIITTLNLNEFINNDFNYYSMLIMNSSILTKMGAAPFHFWFPEIMEGLNWMNCFIMLTWQKIAPFVILMMNSKMTLFLSLIIISSSMISGILGINQISLRKILTYSSINHIAWMISSLMNSQSIWLFYFMVYSIITINIIYMLKTLNIYYLKQLFNSMNSNKMFKMLFIMNFLSLGGLPPFLGFFPKWLTIMNLTQNNFYLISVILITFTLITLFFYLRLTFSTLTLSFNETPMMTSNKFSFSFIMFNFISLMGMIFSTFLFNFF
uniref:NADH dehydrogenase subunit 2 n=1 Tax=Helota thoracica TaxID=3031831 RepID=UPI0023F53A5E|nr:NADH dehydrogenase subunit 2 [Helota thoracica]WEA76627.1 NADH dehydrogenase subunit 2 [Helota thoracica]